ncbi:uncharacterized protein LOC102779518 isoform X3 [Neolamprologus brichardi]|uniref:uncharacterized protein LOC102779518 isoform X3 n=1 Tax=Neolamprologus brichardi TaxID=32507 RepID=UPI001643C95F|nr:uncharacterized protein LOC102779518 isoform X3 [Neolamprologus brichardi]
MGKAKMKTKWLQDSSPESLQHPPEKTYWTTFGALLARSSSPQPSTSGFQHGRPKAANQEVNTAQPVRRSSPQPSTSGLHLNRDWRARRSSPHPSTSGLHLNRDWRARRSSPQPSTSAFKRGRKEADQEELPPGRRVRSSSPQPFSSGLLCRRQINEDDVVQPSVFYLFLQPWKRGG